MFVRNLTYCNRYDAICFSFCEKITPFAYYIQWSLWSYLGSSINPFLDFHNPIDLRESIPSIYVKIDDFFKTWVPQMIPNTILGYRNHTFLL